MVLSVTFLFLYCCLPFLCLFSFLCLYLTFVLLWGGFSPSLFVRGFPFPCNLLSPFSFSFLYYVFVCNRCFIVTDFPVVVICVSILMWTRVSLSPVSVCYALTSNICPIIDCFFTIDLFVSFYIQSPFGISILFISLLHLTFPWLFVHLTLISHLIFRQLFVFLYLSFPQLCLFTISLWHFYFVCFPFISSISSDSDEYYLS